MTQPIGGKIYILPVVLYANSGILLVARLIGRYNSILHSSQLEFLDNEQCHELSPPCQNDARNAFDAANTRESIIEETLSFHLNSTRTLVIVVNSNSLVGMFC